MADWNGDHRMIRDVRIGLETSATRREFDSMGKVDVPADRYWGAQTQRSLYHFSIGNDRMPKAVYHAYGYVKKACALVNQAAGRLPEQKARAIIRAAEETIAGKLDEHFPLYVWQTARGPAMRTRMPPRTKRESGASSPPRPSAFRSATSLARAPCPTTSP